MVVDENDTQFIANCPFCGKDGKFYISKEGSVWDCKVCGMEGDLSHFFYERMKQYQETLTREDKQVLLRDKGIRPKTLTEWGAGYCREKAFFAFPVANGSVEKVTNIKRYQPGAKSKLYGTKNCRSDFMRPMKRPRSRRVWITEGEWDAMALWQAMPQNAKEDVVASPGANIIPPKESLSQFQDRDVVLGYDHDSPGRKGMLKMARTLRPIAASVSYIKWSDELEDGYDIRDYLVRDKHSFSDLVSMISTDFPQGDMEEPSDPMTRPMYTGVGMAAIDVMQVFSKWLSMETYDCLDVLFGTVFANRLPGDPIWLYLISPPGGGKTELIHSLLDAPGTVSKSSLTSAALITGSQFAGDTDPSLIAHLDQKILLVKDFTTILNLHKEARDEIFGILRDAYDGTCEKHFGWGARRYESKFGIIAGVTHAIENEDRGNTSMGERFLRYNLNLNRMSSSNRRKAIRKALDNTEHSDIMRKELREAAHQVVNVDLSSLQTPHLPSESEEKILMLAELVSRMRARVDQNQYTREVETIPVHEFGTRLAKQLKKLGQGIALYNRETSVSGKAYQVLLKVARSTIPGRNEHVLRALYTLTETKYDTLSSQEIGKAIRLPTETVRHVMAHMNLLKIVDKTTEGEWRLRKDMRRMIDDIGLYATDTGFQKARREVQNGKQ